MLAEGSAISVGLFNKSAANKKYYCKRDSTLLHQQHLLSAPYSSPLSILRCFQNAFCLNIGYFLLCTEYNSIADLGVMFALFYFSTWAMEYWYEREQYHFVNR